MLINSQPQAMANPLLRQEKHWIQYIQLTQLRTGVTATQPKTTGTQEQLQQLSLTPIHAAQPWPEHIHLAFIYLHT